MKTARLLIASMLVLSGLAACAPRTKSVVAPTVPRHPEFVFPAGQQTADVRLLDDHQAAWHLLQSGDLRDAERRYHTVLKRNATFFPAHAGLGYAALARKDYKEALTHFDRALSAAATYAPAHAGKGQTFLAMGQRGQALASFDAALAADPTLVNIRSAADILRVQGLQGGVADARKAAADGRLSDARTAYLQAIQASPQSPFLYRELAEVERREGNLTAALEHAQKAVSMESTEPRNFIVLASILEARGQFAKALDALSSAQALEPSDALGERIDALRKNAAFAAMPDDFRAIDRAEAVTRAQLAALVGVRLEVLVKRAPQRGAALITDARSHWAEPWILPVARAGFMEVYANHSFQPNTIIRRGDLAFTVSQILGFIAAENPKLAAEWRNARRTFPDLSPGHLRHGAAAIAVAAGVMPTLENGSFHLSRPVTGREAIAAVDRLSELASASARR